MEYLWIPLAYYTMYVLVINVTVSGELVRKSESVSSSQCGAAARRPPCASAVATMMLPLAGSTHANMHAAPATDSSMMRVCDTVNETVATS